MFGEFSHDCHEIHHFPALGPATGFFPRPSLKSNLPGGMCADKMITLMKANNTILMISLVILSAGGLANAAEKDEILLLSFFRDNGQDGVFLAASEDGLNFKALNDDKPVMKPADWEGQRLTRDPSMVFHDGKFHAVWTSNWNGNCFGYAESADLVHWSQPVKVEPFPAALQQPGNVWAPEICWDPVQKNYLIFWSSTLDKRGHRIYGTRTADGKTFSAAKIFLDPKYSCIDGMMALDETATTKRWVLVYKNEEARTRGGKNLRLATAPADFSQPWSLVETPVAGPGSTVRPHEMAEGPSLLKRDNIWYLYWDAFANGHYSLATSTDLKNWTDRTAELKLPPNPRHGTVSRVPRHAVGWLSKPKAQDKL